MVEESLELSGRKLTLQIDRFARQADVSVFGRMGDTCVLVTVVAGPVRTDLDYLPLFVEYIEKLYAGGIIKGSRWVKREGAPSDEAILTDRLIDRGIRPLFPKNLRRDIQVVITLLSVDGENSPDIISSIAVSTALHLSGLPWKGPVSTTRIGYNPEEKGGDGYIINPVEQDQDNSKLDLVVTSGEEKVLMIETKAEDLNESIIIKGILLAKKENRKIISFIKSLREKTGKEGVQYSVSDKEDELVSSIKKHYGTQIHDITMKAFIKEKGEKEELNKLLEELHEKYKDAYDKATIKGAISKVMRDKIRHSVLVDKKRVDGRKFDEIRNIIAETSILPRTHGSAIFQRGQTQVLSISTLGSPRMGQLIEGPEGKEIKRYLHHYYMPPYSTGEVGRFGWPSRREKGHGALAEKAIEPVLPSEKDFPYVIRVVSEVMSSNGSTSMASTCGSTLALMDAGVPIKKPVAGISVGMIYESDSNYQLLVDIAGIEDYMGDMDFKVAGTEDGVTAIQLDVKSDGITDKMIEETFSLAKTARLALIKKIKQVLSEPRKEVSQYAPKVIMLTPPEDKIGEIIGPGGKNIRQIIAKTGAEVDVDDDGKVSISGISKEAVGDAVQLVENVYRELHNGEEFEGVVTRTLQFGAFVEILPGKEGMVHISKMGKGFIKKVEDVLKPEDRVKVRVIKTDERGRIDLELIEKL